jgi:hypothetical protein
VVITRRDGEILGGDAVEELREIGDEVEAGLAGEVEEKAADGGIRGAADAWQEEECGGDAASPAVRGDGGVHAEEEPVSLLPEGGSDVFGRGCGMEAEGFQGWAVARGVIPEATVGEGAEAAFVPADIGGSGLDEDEVWLELPGEAVDMLPSLAWRVARHGGIDDFECGARGREIKGEMLEEAVVAGALGNTPAGGDGITDQSDAPDLRGFGHDGEIVAHAEGIGVEGDLCDLARQVGFQDAFPDISDGVEESRCDAGRDAHVGRCGIGEGTSGVLKGFVVAGFDADEIKSVPAVILECGGGEWWRQERPEDEGAGEDGTGQVAEMTLDLKLKAELGEQGHGDVLRKNRSERP